MQPGIVAESIQAVFMLACATEGHLDDALNKLGRISKRRQIATSERRPATHDSMSTSSLHTKVKPRSVISNRSRKMSAILRPEPPSASGVSELLESLLFVL